MFAESMPTTTTTIGCLIDSINHEEWRQYIEEGGEVTRQIQVEKWWNYGTVIGYQAMG